MAKPPAPSESFSAPSGDLARLPPRVAALRAKILEACATGDLEALRIPVEWNEVPPLFERGLKKGPGFDPLDALKARSFDGAGREMLSILKSVLEKDYVAVTRGPFESYLWPAFAARPMREADVTTRRAMLQCQRFADLGADPPLIHRVRIGKDGTWHTFLPEP